MTATVVIHEYLAAVCPPSEASFYEACKRHDLTFVYSDDGRVYQRGCESLAAIVSAAKHLPPGVAARIWNSVVDEKLVAEARASFYWMGDK